MGDKHPLGQEMTCQPKARGNPIRIGFHIPRGEKEARQRKETFGIWLAGIAAHRPARARGNIDEIVGSPRRRAGRKVEAETQRIEKSRFPAHEERPPMGKILALDGVEKNPGDVEDGRMRLAFGQRRSGNRTESIKAGQRLPVFEHRAGAGFCEFDGKASEMLVQPRTPMDVQRVAEAVVYMAGLPLDANVLFLTVMATKMPFVGRG